MKRALPLLTLLFSLSMPLASAAQAPPRVRVFVTSIGAQDGFTDPSKDNRDTVKNLKDDIRGTRDLELAESPDDAAIVLTVLGRETAAYTAGFFGPARDRMILVKFAAGEIATELRASAQGGTLASGGAWSKASGKIVDQVVDWVKANRSRLRAR